MCIKGTSKKVLLSVCQPVTSLRNKTSFWHQQEQVSFFFWRFGTLPLRCVRPEACRSAKTTNRQLARCCSISAVNSGLATGPTWQSYQSLTFINFTGVLNKLAQCLVLLPHNKICTSLLKTQLFWEYFISSHYSTNILSLTRIDERISSHNTLIVPYTFVHLS